MSNKADPDIVFISYVSSISNVIRETIDNFQKDIAPVKITVADNPNTTFDLLSKASLCVCDVTTATQLCVYQKRENIPQNQKIPTILIVSPNLMEFCWQDKPHIHKVNVVGMMGITAPYVGKNWQHMAHVLTTLKKQDAPAPFSAHDFAKAFKETPEPQGPDLETYGFSISPTLYTKKDALQPLPQSILQTLSR
ncbi:MAG: hypothetical protein AB7S81_04750 [Bdellovibrionales bacterium]